MKIYAKKSLGQHFLNSKHVLEQIISAAHIQRGETVLEIGPGTGVLTSALLDAGAKVIAVEKDHIAWQFLKIKYDQVPELTLLEGDILESDTLSLLQTANPAQTELNQAALPDHYSIIANIPYYITGAILEKFLENEPRPDRMVLLVQKEVAERIMARDGKESILSVSVKAFGTPKIIATVPPGAFTPPPTVDSAILSIENISGDKFTEKSIGIRKFFEIVRAGFAHKRKYAIRNLEEVIEAAKLEVIWNELGLDKKIRAEDMIVGQWVSIASKA